MPRKPYKDTHYDRKRGQHRKRASAETATWEREHLMPPCPPWLDEAAYRKLWELRNR